MRKRLVRAGLGYGAALALVAQSAPARAGAADPPEPGCAVSLLPSEASDAWKEAVGELVRRLRASPDEASDCGGVTVHVTEDGAIVVFLTRDGRQAVRHIPSPSDLVPVVEVLAVTLPLAAPRTLRETAPPDLAAPPAADRPPQPSASSGAHVIVGARAGGRLGSPGGFASPLLGGSADVTVGRWELGVVGQWDPAHTLVGGSVPGGFQMSSFAVGVNVGRREPLGPVALVGGGTLSVGITNESGATADTGTGATGTGQGTGEGAGGSSRAEPRAGAYVGIVVPRNSRFRARFELGADFVASRPGQTRTIDPALPPLPWWSATTSAGVEWEIP